MKIKAIFLLFTLIVILFLVASPGQDLTSHSKHEVEDFTLLDHNGNSYHLYYNLGQKAVVLMSYELGCLIARQSVITLEQLRQRYEKKGFQFILIDASREDQREALQKEVKKLKIHIPILMDESQIVSESLGLTRTAEVILIEPKSWRIVYRGPIDDQKEYLRLAFESLRWGWPLKDKKVPTKGRLIKFENPVKQISYTQDVVPILEKHCVVCHYTDGPAPWAMTDYKKITTWSKMMREALRVKRMPPPSADPYYGEYLNNNYLKADELRTLIHWIESQCPKEESEDPIPAIEKARAKNQWPYGEPDIILTAKNIQHLPATGVPHWQFNFSKETIPKDLWAKAIVYKPSTKRTIHHALAMTPVKSPYQNSQRPFDQEGVLKSDEELLCGYTSQWQEIPFPQGTGKFLPKGSRIKFATHYITTGKPETDQPQLGIYLSQQPLKPLIYMYMQMNKFKIPKKTQAHQLTAQHTFKEGVMLYGVSPHAHYRSRSAKVTAVYPDKNEEILLSVPSFDSAWETLHLFKNPKFMPAGTIIKVESTFDNSIFNPKNPNPNQDVTFSMERVEGEMFWTLLAYSVVEENDQK